MEAQNSIFHEKEDWEGQSCAQGGNDEDVEYNDGEDDDDDEDVDDDGDSNDN